MYVCCQCECVLTYNWVCLSVRVCALQFALAPSCVMCVYARGCVKVGV